MACPRCSPGAPQARHPVADPVRAPDAKEIRGLHTEHVPPIMGWQRTGPRSSAVEKLAKADDGDSKFDAVKTGIGIATARWREERPMIFKGSVVQAHRPHATFKPGFGRAIADAVVASCSTHLSGLAGLWKG